MVKTKTEIKNEMMESLQTQILMKELAYAYFSQAKGNTEYYTKALAAEHEKKELTKQLEFFKIYDETKDMGTDGRGTKGEVSGVDA